jgi:hypothetical protein
VRELQNADTDSGLSQHSLPMSCQGWRSRLLSREDIETITSGISACRATGATVHMPLWLSCLARAHAELGQFDQAWRCIDEAITTIETTKERWPEAEVHRIVPVAHVTRAAHLVNRGKPGHGLRAKLFA